MGYFKLMMDAQGENDIVCHYQDDFGIRQNVLNVGKICEGWDGRFEFFYDETEGYVLTDYAANDKGWFVVSNKLRTILKTMNTAIQFLPVRIIEINSKKIVEDYSIANIIRVVDAFCLEKSKYFKTEILGIGTVYTVSKYAIYAEKTEDSDVFKLANRQEIPIFVSERFKERIEEENVTGIYLREIEAV